MGYSSTGANRSCARQQGKAAAGSGIGDLPEGCLYPMCGIVAPDHAARGACYSRRALIPGARFEVLEDAEAFPASTGAGETVVRLAGGLPPMADPFTGSSASRTRRGARCT